jgi:hypothetical protein
VTDGKPLSAILILFFGMCVFAGCGDRTPPPPPKYKVGDIVYMKLDDRKGVVCKEWANYYDIRVLSKETDNVNIATGAGIGSGGVAVGNSSPYTILEWVKEEELYQEPK